METKSPCESLGNEKSICTALNRLFNQFIKERKFGSHLSDETIRGYCAVFALFEKLMPEVIGTEVLTPEMIIEFFARVETRSRRVGKNKIKIGVKSSTIKTQWSKLNVFFSWLHNRGYIDQNPLSKIKPPHVYYEDPKALSDTDIRKLYAAIALHSTNSLLLRRDLMMVSVLLYCGLRKNEFVSLRVDDIDTHKHEITVRSETSKSKNRRVLKLHPTLLLHVKDYFKERNARGLKTECLIVANRGDRGLTADGLKHWVQSLVKKSGVRFHLHQLRHTFACKLAEADVHPFKIQKLMGHTSLAMTVKYVRSMRTEHMEEDIRKIRI